MTHLYPTAPDAEPAPPLAEVAGQGAEAPYAGGGLSVAIACGGTGGHLFPGLAVAAELQRRGCAVTLLISPKDVDQQAVQSATGMEVVTLPAVALQGRNGFAFAYGFLQSWRAARRHFRAQPPSAVLAMGGFTSVPPVLAARGLGAKTFLHESNTIPGRANRWLARWVDQAFVGFPQAVTQLRAKEIIVTGTPVRPGIGPRDVAACRAALGFDPARPVVLVMGGSQGARGINDMILAALPHLCAFTAALEARRFGRWQWLHLTGPHDGDKVRAAYAKLGLTAVVRPFLQEMDLALAAATVAVNRAGASSLAEFAALRLPSVLVPLPHAADDHQRHNARAFAQTGAAFLLEQSAATSEKIVTLLGTLVNHPPTRAKMQAALAAWDAPRAAARIAELVLAGLSVEAGMDPAAGAGESPMAEAEGESSASELPMPETEHEASPDVSRGATAEGSRGLQPTVSEQPEPRRGATPDSPPPADDPAKPLSDLADGQGELPLSPNHSGVCATPPAATHEVETGAELKIPRESQDPVVPREARTPVPKFSARKFPGLFCAAFPPTEAERETRRSPLSVADALENNPSRSPLSLTPRAKGEGNDERERSRGEHSTFNLQPSTLNEPLTPALPSSAEAKEQRRHLVADTRDQP